MGFTIDRDADSALGLAGCLALRGHGRLTIVAATAPSLSMLLSPHGALAWKALPRDLEERLRSPMGELPSDVGVTHLTVEGGSRAGAGARRASRAF